MTIKIEKADFESRWVAENHSVVDARRYTLARQHGLMLDWCGIWLWVSPSQQPQVPPEKEAERIKLEEEKIRELGISDEQVLTYFLSFGLCLRTVPCGCSLPTCSHWQMVPYSAGIFTAPDPEHMNEHERHSIEHRKKLNPGYLQQRDVEIALNGWIARFLMGKDKDCLFNYFGDLTFADGKFGIISEEDLWATSWRGMEILDAEMEAQGWMLRLQRGAREISNPWSAHFVHSSAPPASVPPYAPFVAATAPLAVARAALFALVMQDEALRRNMQEDAASGIFTNHLW